MLHAPFHTDCTTSATQETARAALAIFVRSRQIIDLPLKGPPPTGAIQGEPEASRRTSDGRSTTVALKILARLCMAYLCKMLPPACLIETIHDAPIAIVMRSIDSGGLQSLKPVCQRFQFMVMKTFRDPEQRRFAVAIGSLRGEAILLDHLPIDLFVELQGLLIGCLKGVADGNARDGQGFLPRLPIVAGSTPPPR